MVELDLATCNQWILAGLGATSQSTCLFEGHNLPHNTDTNISFLRPLVIALLSEVFEYAESESIGAAPL